jgi:hypothetical protein
VQVGARPDALGRKFEQPRVAIRQREIIGLELAGHRRPEPTTQRVPNVPERMAALAGNAFQGDPHFKVIGMGRDMPEIIVEF